MTTDLLVVDAEGDVDCINTFLPHLELLVSLNVEEPVHFLGYYSAVPGRLQSELFKVDSKIGTKLGKLIDGSKEEVNDDYRDTDLLSCDYDRFPTFRQV